MAEKRRVVLTGAAGLIASHMLDGLRKRYDLVALDIRDTGPDGNPIDDIVVVDLLDSNRDNYRRYFSDADAVMHLGFTRAQDRSDPEQDFRAEYANIEMAYNVYMTALEEKVRRVVVASSNHAADYYETLILEKKIDTISPATRPLSDNYYGWAKEVYEHLGFVFAVGKKNAIDGIPNPLEVVQIRIGGPRETDVSACTPGDMVCVRRALGAYLSGRDMLQLFVKSIETADIRDENGVPFQIFYGISDNPHAFWSIANARKIIGYDPQDNSERRFYKQIEEHLKVVEIA